MKHALAELKYVASGVRIGVSQLDENIVRLQNCPIGALLVGGTGLELL